MLNDAQKFSYQAERDFYFLGIPREAKPYFHLEPYLRCWLDPDKVFRNKRVLDIGAGELTYTRLIADRFAPRDIVACELFRERMLPACQANQNSILKPVSGDCYRLPFKDGSFDVAFASLVMSQFPDLHNAVQEIARVLKRDGVFVCFEPNPFNPVILYRALASPHSANQFLFWPRRVRPVFEANGFTISTRYFYGRFPIIQNRFLGTCIGFVALLNGEARSQ